MSAPQTLQEALYVSGPVRQPIKESLPGQTLQEGRPGPEQEGEVPEPRPPEVPVQRQKTTQALQEQREEEVQEQRQEEVGQQDPGPEVPIWKQEQEA